ncbi:MAG TPA: aspartyl/asparaginyl beta-hydroxylase domain-containing protein [Methylibium sp.]|nr:aspartyl/asparaginyl beta-hydroxylase domain-containing protein [Methylibium sp.]
MAAIDDFASALKRARTLHRDGDVLSAELLYAELHRQDPHDANVLAALGRLALDRGDVERALSFLRPLQAQRPADLRLALQVAGLCWQSDLGPAAIGLLEAALRLAERNDEDAPKAWLALGEMRFALGDADAAGRAWHQALERARVRGWWVDASSIPPAVAPMVERAVRESRAARKRHLVAAVESLHREHGAAALRRVDRAVAAILGEAESSPADPRQRPKFFNFPDLPSEPYLDPARVPGASALTAAYDAIRAEALTLVEQGVQLPGFVDIRPGDRIDNYLGGAAAQPAWDAFFFFRHGRRYDENHARCPRTSEALAAFDLFHLEGQAPEACFSFLAPHTTIKPHYGVSNVRLVMHLPLLVPPDCALNLVDVGEHAWREGELMLFDDTFQHEAWNRSDRVRVVLLMDCWHPGLTPVERDAVGRMIRAASEFDTAL